MNGKGLSNRAPVRTSQDFVRVRGLPVRGDGDYPADLRATMTKLCTTPAGQAQPDVALFDVQAKALYDLGTYKHSFCPIKVGGGKTLFSFLAPRMIGAKRPLLLLPASLVTKTDRAWREAAKDWKVSQQLRMMSYQLLGRVSGANKLDLLKPDLIIADECFTGDTLVRTQLGDVRIDEVMPGDYVWSLGLYGRELRRVIGVGESQSEETYRVRFNGTQYDCTAGHPWLTVDGWKKSSDLAVGDEVLRDLWGAFHITPVSEASLLLPTLCADEPSNCRELGDFSTCPGQLPASQDERDVASGGPGESLENIERDGAQTEDSGRQREGDVDPAGTFAECFRRRLDERIALPLGPVRDSGVVGGHRAQDREDCGGSGRSQSPSLECPGPGRTEDRVFRGFGLDRVEGVERLCANRPAGGCLVYNLHVEGTNNYILRDGHVVHNCHLLKNQRAAVTRRVGRYLRANPQAVFVPMSGTIMKKSIRDFAHLLEWSHGQDAPIPLYEATLAEWAEALDEGVNAFQQRDPGVLVDLMPASGSTPPANDTDNGPARRVFQRRIRATPGIIVADTTDDFDGSLEISALEYTPNEATDANFQILRETMCRPDGWALAEAMQVWAVARQLALGMHYSWDPSPPEEWLDARKQWASFVRETLKSPRSQAEGVDSELQVANGVLRGDIEDEYGVLEHWRGLKPSFKINSMDVWHDDTALKVCQEWLRTHERGIVWCEHVFFAKTLSKLSGVPYYGAKGLDAQGNFIEDHPEGSPVIASIAANCTGRNLQFKWSQNLVTAPPSDSERWEQLIARTHRVHQKEDTVTVDVLMGCREHFESIPRSLASSDVKRDLLGFTQKLRVADILWPERGGRKGFRWA